MCPNYISDLLFGALADMHRQSNGLIQEALALYPAPGTPGSPFATQYDRAWTMAQEIIFGCMLVFRSVF